jgi:hypothetical protein
VKKLNKFETAFMTIFWNTILIRVNETSKLLQSTSMELSAAVALLKSLSAFLVVQRDNFDNYYKKTLDAMTAIGDAACERDFEIGRARRPRRLHDDSLQPAVVLTGQERFKIECFYVILDTLVADLTRRTNAYAEINQRFCFLNPHEDIVTATAAMHTAVEFYQGHLEPDLVEEWTQWRAFLRELPENQKDTAKSAIASTSASWILQVMSRYDMQSAFPNVNIALKIYLTLPVSNCTGERSFSHMKRIKNYLRSTMLQERLSALAILNIENELVKKIDFEQLVEAFATTKSRRRYV